MSARTDFYDVAVVGGGPAGASAAIHLAARGARVLLAEAKRFPRAKLCGEFISPECVAHFARLGVAAEMAAAGGSEVEETIFYTGAGRGITVPSAWFGGGGRALGLSRAEMDARLLARAREAGVEVLEEAQAVGLVSEGETVGGVRLGVGGEARVCRASVTIDATGRGRALARLAGKGSRAGARRAGRRRPPLVAFKAHLEGALGASSACEIYLYRGGYGGLSPVEGGLSNLCFIARGRDVRACGSEPERVMREVLMENAHAARTLRGARAVGPWLSVALEGFGRREPSPAPGLLAVGDAASFIDPFTGSGMLMALESGELAAGAVARWFEGAGRRARETRALDELSRDYRALYDARFGARLRLCGWLRRAAFAPHAFVELTARALGQSARLRRTLARATRTSAGTAQSHY